MTENVTKLAEINLGIVCPMANERQTAEKFVCTVLEKCRGFKSLRFFAIFDKACKDGTFELLNNLQDKLPELSVIWAPEDTCVVDAYVRGYKEAIGAGCDWVLEMDAGFSHRPDNIPQFFEKMSEGYDCVFGSRFCQGGQFTNSPWHRRFISRGGTIMANILLGAYSTQVGHPFHAKPAGQSMKSAGDSTGIRPPLVGVAARVYYGYTSGCSCVKFLFLMESPFRVIL